jgi:hypothetical protein
LGGVFGVDKMKRYVISPVIGDGQTPDTAYRSAVGDVQDANAINLIKSDPETGHPVWFFAFSRVGVPGTLQNVLQVSNSYVFPDFPLDAQMSQMDSEARSGMVQSVQAFNVDGAGTHVDATHADTDSFRTVIEKIARHWQSIFNANHFDVAESV